MISIAFKDDKLGVEKGIVDSLVPQSALDKKDVFRSMTKHCCMPVTKCMKVNRAQSRISRFASDASSVSSKESVN